MIKKISHIGIAVKDLDKAIEFYKKIGLHVESTEVVESQKVKVAFIPVGDVRIELLAATSEDSPIAKFLEKKGDGIHHIAYETDGIVEQINFFNDSGVEMLDKNPREGAHGTLIAFLHPKSSGRVLTEICQAKE